MTAPQASSVTVTQVGDELAVILPEPVLRHLGVREGDTLALEQTPTGFVLSRRDPKIARQIETARKIMSRYCNTLRELAK